MSVVSPLWCTMRLISAGVPMLEPFVDRIEPAKEGVLLFVRIMRPQPERALRGLERHRVDAAEQRRDGDDERKLAVHLPDDARQERGRQERPP